MQADYVYRRPDNNRAKDVILTVVKYTEVDQSKINQIMLK